LADSQDGTLLYEHRPWTAPVARLRVRSAINTWGVPTRDVAELAVVYADGAVACVTGAHLSALLAAALADDREDHALSSLPYNLWTFADDAGRIHDVASLGTTIHLVQAAGCCTAA